MDKRAVKWNFIISAAGSLLHIAFGVCILILSAVNDKNLDELKEQTDSMGNGTVEFYGKLFNTFSGGFGRIVNSVIRVVFGEIPLAIGVIMLALALIALAGQRLKAPYRLMMTMAHIIMLLSGIAYSIIIGGAAYICGAVIAAAAVYGLVLTYSKAKNAQELYSSGGGTPDTMD